MFGRKGLGTAGQKQPQDGRAWVDGQLAKYDRPGSMEFAQHIGLKLFDASYHAMKDDRGVRIEAIVAMLSSVGGYLCLLPILKQLKAEGLNPADIGMVTIRGNDGRIYQFGDAPNRLLCEHPMSLISLVFGAAHAHGAAVSLEMVNQEMSFIASRVGTDDYMSLDLPPAHQVDAPDAWLRHFLPFVLDSISAAYLADLQRQGMPIDVDTMPADAKLPPPFMLARIVAFAIQQAIDVGHQALDATMLARISMQCAMRTAKVDTSWLDA
ncbi:hypothetical protein [Sphingomonas jaspsi]|uniref:hypothetical protein n=1 Tax=Sphingomonas jaspsi TaxID=392409 RepID=UPI0004BC906F|nr:hypothetical protein [Sphingomonas jaspsi]